MVNNDVLIGILVFLLLVIIAIVVIITSTTSNKPATNDGVQTVQTTFLNPCQNVTCGSGFVCDPTSFVCKKELDQVCFAASECLSGYFCSGKCVTGPTGSLNQYCPCGPGYLCDEQEDGYSICKGGSGTTCSTNEDCFSVACINGACLGGYPNAYPCIYNTDCASQNCSNGYCQEPLFQTGALGAACAGNCVGWTGAVCTFPGSTCTCFGQENEPGNCTESGIGFLLPCVTGYGICSDLFTCVAPSGLDCTSSNTGCFCEFHYPDTTVTSPPNFACMGGMTAKEGACFGETGSGCVQSQGCASGVCSGPPVLTMFTFNSSPQNNFFGSTGIAAVPISYGPNNATTPRRMFVDTSGSIDTIYLFDMNAGVYSIQYDTQNQSVLSDWQLLLPIQSSDGKIVLDVSYNNGQFLVTYQVAGQVSGTVLYVGFSLDNLIPLIRGNFSNNGQTGSQTEPGVTIVSADISPANDISGGGDILINVIDTRIPNQPVVSYVNAFGTQTYEQLFTTGVVPQTPVTTYPDLGYAARFYYDVTEKGPTGGPIVCPVNTTIPSGASIACASRYNVSYIGIDNTTISGTTPLKFTGNLSPVSLPSDVHSGQSYSPISYSIYSPSGTGMQQSKIITISYPPGVSEYVEVVLTYAGTNAPLQGRIYVNAGLAPNAVVLVSANAYYMFSGNSCS